MFRVLLLLFLSSSLFAESLKKEIAQMLIVGFKGDHVPHALEIQITKEGLGGVILFKKNITSPSQLKSLTSKLHTLDSQLFIATDQEGGLVERLSDKNGFFHTPKPIEVASMGEESAKVIYHNMATLLATYGINVNFAPSVDLAKNPKNRVIYRYGRAFSKDPKSVIAYASIFIKAMQNAGVLSVIKHFPGHGSSLKDSHQGFVDVSELWSKEELIPFFSLPTNAVMSAHIFNRHIDPDYPATLSKKSLDQLRNHGFSGIIISDDMQMKAISKNYDLDTALRLSINAGVDVLLFGNQLAKPRSAKVLISHIEALVKRGEIDEEKIHQAYARIKRLKKELFDGR